MSEPWGNDQKRRHFQKVKSLSQSSFERYMNLVLNKAYMSAERAYEDALEIALPPRYRKAVQAKVEKIRVEWDGITPYEIEQ